MKSTTLHQGTSDPVSYTCTCPASTTSTPGTVLLFYRYYAAPPPLHRSLLPQAEELPSLAAWYTNLTTSLGLGGKIRIAKEGFNVTVGGTADAIASFIEECLSHCSFAGLDLEIEARRKEFFKPSPGCACVFSGKANVRVVAEATPMGVEGYAPASWSDVVALSPHEFHARLLAEEEGGESGGRLLLDVRNHYESKIGYFVSGKGEKAVTPPIRRFSQWPQYVRAHAEELKGQGGGTGRSIMTYCTGGIRCEKGVRFMQERVRKEDKVFTLNGGIAAYLDWMEVEIREGRKTAADSLFKGKNYVFDARGAMGLNEEDLVSSCHVCQLPSGRLGKCRSDGCHLVLVVCEDCEETRDPRCCKDCHDIDVSVSSSIDEERRPRPMCACEKEREAQLWAGERSKKPKAQGWRKQERNQEVDIQVHIIDEQTIP